MIKSSHDKNAALQAAVKNPSISLETIKILITNGSDPSLKTPDDENILMLYLI